MHGERVRKRLPLAVRQAVDRRRLESRAIRFLRGIAIERMAARQHFIAEAGKSEDIVALVGLARGNAKCVIRVDQPAIRHDVEQLHLVAECDEDVLRAQVAVHDGLRVQVLQRVADGTQHGGRLFGRQRARVPEDESQ